MLVILTTHTIQYQVPIWKALAARGKVPFKVLYMSDQGLKERFAPGFGRTIAWDIDLLGGYLRGERCLRLLRRSRTAAAAGSHGCAGRCFGECSGQSAGCSRTSVRILPSTIIFARWRGRRRSIQWPYRDARRSASHVSQARPADPLIRYYHSDPLGLHCLGSGRYSEQLAFPLGQLRRTLNLK